MNESINWRRYGAYLALTLLLSLIVFESGAVARRGTEPQIPAALAAVIEQAPDGRLNLIVQTSDPAALTAVVERAGGRVTRNLHIINAVAVELPAGAVPALAAEASVRWISVDGAVSSAGKGSGPGCQKCPPNYYLETLNVEPVWEMGLRGEGVTIAVIDSGVQRGSDFLVDPTAKLNEQVTRVIEREAFGTDTEPNDRSGHGTHVAGIMGGNGYDSGRFYSGIAPMVNLISLSVSDTDGMSSESNVVAAMQWVLENKDAYNIRVVNLSLNADTTDVYHNSAMDAAAEILWFNGIVVVASAGNKYASANTVQAAPANDPFIITVGAVDEKGSGDPTDDVLASFSAFGQTLSGYEKPEIVAPGKDIVSVLSSASQWDKDYQQNVANKGTYFRASGTSMAAPMVSAAAALILQNEPYLTPDQVKYRLIATARQDGTGQTKVPHLDIYAAVTTPTTESANTGLVASQLLWSGDEPVQWDSVNWNSVNWNSVNWNSVNWNSVNWNSVNWNSVNWND